MKIGIHYVLFNLIRFFENMWQNRDLPEPPPPCTNNTLSFSSPKNDFYLTVDVKKTPGAPFFPARRLGGLPFRENRVFELRGVQECVFLQRFFELFSWAAAFFRVAVGIRFLLSPVVFVTFLEETGRLRLVVQNYILRPVYLHVCAFHFFDWRAILGYYTLTRNSSIRYGIIRGNFITVQCFKCTAHYNWSETE